PRRRPASASVFCGSWRRPASHSWPLTCRSRPSAMWRSPATPFVAFRRSGATDRLLDWPQRDDRMRLNNRSIAASYDAPLSARQGATIKQERQERPMTKTIMLIHGAWLNAQSWEGFKARYEARGYTVIAPSWPLDDRSPAELRASPNPAL